MRDTYESGKWLALCQRCGMKHFNTQLKLEWTKLRVCKSCFEYRQPQDFVQGVKDGKAVPWVRRPLEVDAEIDYYDE